MLEKSIIMINVRIYAKRIAPIPQKYYLHIGGYSTTTMDPSLSLLAANSGVDTQLVAWLTVAIIALVLLSGFFSGTETAFSCANKIKLKSLITTGKKNAKAVFKYADTHYDKLVTAILVGNNIVNLSASAIGTVLFAELLRNNA